MELVLVSYWSPVSIRTQAFLHFVGHLVETCVSQELCNETLVQVYFIHPFLDRNSERFNFVIRDAICEQWRIVLSCEGGFIDELKNQLENKAATRWAGYFWSFHNILFNNPFSIAASKIGHAKIYYF